MPGGGAGRLTGLPSPGLFLIPCDAMHTPNADMAEVPPAKVTRYLLSLESEDGRSKAAFFLSRGFSLEN